MSASGADAHAVKPAQSKTEAPCDDGPWRTGCASCHASAGTGAPPWGAEVDRIASGPLLVYHGVCGQFRHQE